MASKRTNPRVSRASRRRANAQVLRSIARAERDYVEALRGVMRGIAQAYVKALEPFLQDIAAKEKKDRRDAGTPLSNEFDILGARVRVAIEKSVRAPFKRMADAVDDGNKKSQTVLGIKPSALGIDAEIDKARDINIRLVEDAHRAYAAQVRKVVEDPENFGLQVEELKAKLLERGDVAESRAELIARDQTLKLNGQITETRQKNAGVTSYVWSTSLDERVRESHAALEGQTFDWNNPPDVGHPGQDFQCRCTATPVVEELDEIFQPRFSPIPS